MKMPWESGLESITGLISEFITDDDKMAEINLEMEKVKAGVITQLLTTKTTPKVDAFVKVLIAFRDIILPLLRPVGSACMTGFAAWCLYKEIPLAGATEAMMAGAFPAWMASRHVHKTKAMEAPAWDEDD